MRRDKNGSELIYFYVRVYLNSVEIAAELLALLQHKTPNQCNFSNTTAYTLECDILLTIVV
jgi:hypothetical protein